jgi:hypothetical protein
MVRSFHSGRIGNPGVNMLRAGVARSAETGQRRIEMLIDMGLSPVAS